MTRCTSHRSHPLEHPDLGVAVEKVSVAGRGEAAGAALHLKEVGLQVGTSAASPGLSRSFLCQVNTRCVLGPIRSLDIFWHFAYFHDEVHC